jgi:hypothetical protein
MVSLLAKGSTFKRCAQLPLAEMPGGLKSSHMRQ